MPCKLVRSKEWPAAQRRKGGRADPDQGIANPRECANRELARRKRDCEINQRNPTRRDRGVGGLGGGEEGGGLAAELALLQAAEWTHREEGGCITPCTCRSRLEHRDSPDPEWKVLKMMPVSI